MSKEFKNIDELFQSSFEGDTAEVPAFVKTNIDKRIAGNTKKFAWWKWGGLFLILTLTGFAALYLNDNLSDEISLNKNENSTNLLLESDQNQLVPDNLKLDENISVNENDLNRTEKNQHNNSVSVSFDPVTSNESISDNDNNNNHLETSSTEYDNDVESANANDLIRGAPQNKTLPDNEKDKSGEDNSGSADIPQNKNGFSSVLISGLNPRQFSFETQRKSVLVNEPKGLVNKPVSFPFNSVAENVFANAIHSREVYNPWMITANGVMSLSQSKYTAVNSNELTTYQNSNEDKPGFGFDLNATCRLQNSLTFGTGLSLMQLAENYHYFKEDVFIDSTLTWSYQDIYEYDSLLDTTIWVGVDSSYTADYDTTKKVFYDHSGETKATYFSIPLSVGTQIITEKFRFDFYAAGRFNYLLNATGGYVMNDAFQTFTNTNQIFRKMYFDLVLGTNVHFKLTDHFFLTGSLRYKPALQEIYQGLSFNKSLNTLQFGAGVSWKF
ncbi:MAG: hypothetical protein IPM77_09560 [Crocinitomicaceae bacterium]|nr:hypothetical protein [Crocinitomicaceae bacterium]